MKIKSKIVVEIEIDSDDFDPNYTENDLKGFIEFGIAAEIGELLSRSVEGIISPVRVEFE